MTVTLLASASSTMAVSLITQELPPHASSGEMTHAANRYVTVRPPIHLASFWSFHSCPQLARHGLNVVLISRTLEKLQAIAEEIGE